MELPDIFTIRMPIQRLTLRECIRPSRIDMSFLPLSSASPSFSYVPTTADGQLHLQAPATVVR